MHSNVVLIVVGVAILVGGMVLVAVSAYLTGKSQKDMSPGWVIGFLLTALGLVLTISASTFFYSDPDIPVGVKMKVVASYISVDGQTMYTLQWQGGKKKPDHEITVDATKLHADWPPNVGNELIMLDDGRAIILPPDENQP